MPNLTQYVHYCCGLINFDTKGVEDVPLLLQEFLKFADSYNKIRDYYIIAHTETEVLHIHFIFYSISQVQVMTYYNKLRKHFVPKFARCDEAIQIEKCENFNAYLKYLLHADSESVKAGKKLYSVDDFVSNVDVDVIDSTIHSKKGSIDAYYLRDCVLDCTNDFELMVKLTLPIFHKYSNEIRLIRESRAFLSEMRAKEREERLEEDIPF